MTSLLCRAPHGCGRSGPHGRRPTQASTNRSSRSIPPLDRLPRGPRRNTNTNESSTAQPTPGWHWLALVCLAWLSACCNGLQHAAVARSTRMCRACTAGSLTLISKLSECPCVASARVLFFFPVGEMNGSVKDPRSRGDCRGGARLLGACPRIDLRREMLAARTHNSFALRSASHGDGTERAGAAAPSATNARVVVHPNCRSAILAAPLHRFGEFESGEAAARNRWRTIRALDGAWNRSSFRPSLPRSSLGNSRRSIES